MTFSSQHHSFDIAIAAQYGVECAILIHHFQHWIRINRFSGRNIKDGKCWTYQTRMEIQAHFPYWTVDEVRRLTDKLVDFGVLLKNNFNKSKIDKTIWYAFVDENKFGVGEEYSKNLYERQNCQSSGKIASPAGKIATPIPDTKPYSKATDMKAEREREEGASPPPPAPPVSQFAFKRITMKKEEYEELVKEFGEAKVAEKLEALDEYADLKPKEFNRYGKHSVVIKNWIKKDLIKNKVEVDKVEIPSAVLQKENLRMNDELVRELKKDYPDICGTFSIYYEAHTLKSREPYFDVSLLMDHKEFCRYLQKKTGIQILEVRFPNG